MKVSLNLIRYYNDHFHLADKLIPEDTNQLLERIGAQLAGIDEVKYVGGKYDGVVIVKVVESRKHENSDHLNICVIDDGGKAASVARDAEGHVQVVCGASNVRAGLTVAWLPPGSTVPNSMDAGEPFVLDAREIRGEVSNGMLASPRELAIGEAHDGILEIDEDIKPGTPFGEYFGLKDDVVIDMENKMFTHRPDCFGVLGVAREIAGIQGRKFTSPKWYDSQLKTEGPKESTLPLVVRNDIPDLVPRFSVATIAGVKIGPSPVWLQIALSALGVRPINNIVDLTNYYMLLTAQPLHAYDYDKVVAQDPGAKQATIVARKPKKGEKLRLLNGKEIEPREDAILIASDTQAIGLGGVMGGGDTEVDENTKNIILEAANFDMYSIRRSSMAHGIFSDAVTRFNKGQSPLQTVAVLAKITEDILDIAGGKAAGPVVDDNHLSDEVIKRGSINPEVKVKRIFINERLGVDLPSIDMAKLLANVEFAVKVDGDTLTVRAPFWRTDIEIPEDIVEEVGRLYGYDKLPLVLPRRDLTPAEVNPAFALKQRLRNYLAAAGANEVLTYSFVHGNLLDKVGQDKKLAYSLGNALSPDLQYYRLSLAPSLLERVHANIKAGYDEFALFEMGKGHSVSEIDDDGLPKEFDRITLVYAADDKTASSLHTGAAYYQARRYLLAILPGSHLLRSLPLKEVDTMGHKLFAEMLKPFDPVRSAVMYDGDRIVGVVGEFKSSVRKALKLPKFSAGFELFQSGVAKAADPKYVPQSRFPKVWQDICLRVPAATTYAQVYDFVSSRLAGQMSDRHIWSVDPVDIYQRPEDTEHKQITVRFTVANHDKTMTDPEVAGMLDLVAEAARNELSAERV